MKYLFSSAVIPGSTKNATFHYRDVSKAEAFEWVQRNRNELISRIGHPQVQEYILREFGASVPVHRIGTHLEVGDEVLVIRLRTRRTGQTPDKLYDKHIVFGIMERTG